MAGPWNRAQEPHHRNPDSGQARPTPERSVKREPRKNIEASNWHREVPTPALAGGSAAESRLCGATTSGARMRHLVQKKERTDKPGSVVGNHSSGTAVTNGLERPTRRRRGPRHGLPIWSCSGWGLPSRSVLPPARCALTAPFHPYLPACAGVAVCFLLHFP